MGISIFVFGFAFLSMAYGDGLPNEADQQTALTNLGLLRLTVEEAIEGACDRLPLLKPKTLCLRSESDAPGNWMVEHALVQSLQPRNFRVFIPDTSGEQSKAGCRDRTVLRYRVVDLDLHYTTTRRKHLFGPQLVARQVHLHILLRLDGQDGEVLWTEEVEGTKEDWILAKMQDVVEREPLPFTPPQLKTDGWNRLAEPALLSAVVGGLIYLFYSTQ